MIDLKQIKAAMTYGSLIPETIQVGKYKIEFEQDTDSENPYTAWDGNAPAMWVSLERHAGNIKEYGDFPDFFDTVSRHWISQNWRKIAKVLNLSESEHDKEARAHAADYGQSLSESRFDLFQDALGEKSGNSWSAALDYMEALRELYTLAGVPAETFQRDGYSQGDSVYGLIVLTKKWAQQVGWNPDRLQDLAACKKDMESQADVYGAWAFGDVYGYTVTDSAGEDVISCWGFYGNSLEDSGLADHLLNDIECHESAYASRKLAKVKAWIKARVPLQSRADMLAVL